MEKITKDLFDKQQMNASHLSNIWGGTSITTCTSPTCYNNCEDTRYITSDDCGELIADETRYCK